MSLYPYQEPAVGHLTDILGQFSAALDASDTGTGKTYVALTVAARLGLQPLVVCPKAARPAWGRVAAELGVPILGVVNPEYLKTGKTPWVAKVTDRTRFQWRLPPGSLVIFDECQMYSAHDSQNCMLLATCKAFGLKTLLLSATAADNPLKLRAIGYLLGLHHFRDFWTWCKGNGCYDSPWGGLAFPTGPGRMQFLQNLHSQIFPTKGSRMRIADIPDFPETQITAEAYELTEANTAAINDIYQELDLELGKLPDSTSVLTKILRARQRVEMLKCPIIVDMAQEFLEEGASVVIFVTFRDTIHALSTLLKDIPHGIIQGDQHADDRESTISRFRCDELRVVLATIGAGGVAISLHDTRGLHPRRSIITPTYSARELTQALGRVHRAGAKSKSLQRIVFAAGTIEADACKKVAAKLANIQTINDGDLTPSFIQWNNNEQKT